MSWMTRIDALVLSRCLLCNGTVHSRKPLCRGCEGDLPWNGRACRRCAMPLEHLPAESADPVCADCLQDPPLFQRAFCAFRYQDPVASLLNRYKHKGRLACGYWLARGLADNVSAYYLESSIEMPECIVPVPLHWRRLQSRGFDQGLEIGKVLAGRLGLPLCRALKRSRHTASQQALSRQQRQHNLSGAFAPRRSLPYRCVALVDDVLTTGSTANEITLLLQAAGVQQVHVWAIARTP